MAKPLTGRHVLAIFVGAFGVIILANLTLAWQAIRTFPGLEVKNSYIASQSFDDRRAAQEALGWDVAAMAEGGLVILSITDGAGRPVQVAKLDAVVGRATHIQDDITPEFAFDGTSYIARAALAEGNWNIRMKATAPDGTPFEQRIILNVRN